jgi:hypothetical protein
MEDIMVIKNEALQLLYNLQGTAIDSKDAYTQAGDAIKQVQHRIKWLEEKRLSYTRPLDESKQRIMADFREITEPLEKFVSNVKSAMLTWQRAEQIRLDQKQAELDAKALELAKNEHISEVIVPVVNNIKTQRGEVATITVRKNWKFRIVDPTLVPDEFYSIDESLIKEAVNKGRRKVEGVEIFQEDSISTR